ncbi:MAG: hypothetical protein E6Y83_16120 [Clostridium butyricum]|nr:hypothetical protein [Clostridium butyricum]
MKSYFFWLEFPQSGLITTVIVYDRIRPFNYIKDIAFSVSYL